MGDTSPSSPGARRRSLPGSVPHRPAAASLEYRPGTVPAGACRGGGSRRTLERGDAPPPEARQGDLDALEQEGWVKASWKKGERREEIKLIAEASGLTFDDARIVALRLYNHFNWLPQLQKRSEQLRAVVGRERRLSLSLVKKEALVQAARELPSDGAGTEAINTRSARLEPTDEDEESYATAEERGSDGKDGFSRYVRGLCVVCNEGSFDQMLEVLFRAYSVARGDRTITRNEMAAILAKHVTYEDSEDSNAERERVYRWLKRQFIHLTTAAASSTITSDPIKDSEQHQGAAPAPAPVAATGRNQDGGFISWDSARKLLRRGPRCLENSLAIDLPSLSKDLWSADLVDVGRTHISSSLQ
eukprot:g3655.t1